MNEEIEEIGLVHKIELMKEEIDALQISLMNEKKPWYKNASTLIALLALLFSFGTTFVSYIRIREQDVQNSKSDLRSMLQRMSSLPKENFEIQKKFMDDPIGTGLLGGYINQENTILSRQAFDLINNLPQDRVTAIEYYSTANALMNAYDLVNALELFRKSVEISNDFNTELAARRGYANLLLLTGKLEEGRHQYELTIDIFSKYKEYNKIIQMTANIETELHWANAEVLCGYKDKGQIHIKNASSYLENLPKTQYKEGLRKKIDLTSVNLNI
jgi:tetratricopeptide (TPR) repeat protein